jgi:hypothetical protein
MPRAGIRNRDPSNKAAADLGLRPRGHWDRHKVNNDILYNEACL